MDSAVTFLKTFVPSRSILFISAAQHIFVVSCFFITKRGIIISKIAKPSIHFNSFLKLLKL